MGRKRVCYLILQKGSPLKFETKIRRDATLRSSAPRSFPHSLDGVGDATRRDAAMIVANPSCSRHQQNQCQTE